MALVASGRVCWSRTALRSLVVQGVAFLGGMGVLLLLAFGFDEAGKGKAVKAGFDLGGGNALAGRGAGGRTDQAGETVDGTGLIDDHRPLAALSQHQPVVGQGVPEGWGGDGADPGRQRGGSHLRQADGRSFLLVPFVGRQHGDSARAEGVAVVHQGAVNVRAFVAQGVEDSAFVTAGAEGNAVVVFPGSLHGLPFGVVVRQADGGAVLADSQIDAVLVPAPTLDVEGRGEGLALQTQLGFQPIPEIGPLILGREGMIGVRVEMDMVKRLLGAAMCSEGFQFTHLGTKITLGDEAARWPKADLLVVLGVQQVPDQGGTARASGGTAHGHYGSPSRSQCTVSTI